MVTQIALTVIALYCLFTIYYIYKEDIKRAFRKSVSPKGEQVQQSKEWLNQSGILGSTKPFIRQKETSRDNSTANYQDVIKEDIFTCETKMELSSAVSKEETEEKLSKQKNEPLEIDFETEYQGDQNYEGEFDEDDELIDLTDGIASGVTYEEIIETAVTIGKINPSVEEKERAVDVINKAGKTDMFEQVVSSISESDIRIKKMLEECDEKISQSHLNLEKSKPVPKEINLNFDLSQYL